ncbi:kinesin-like protein KIN-4A isoform X2 [Aegilops tauschii subsp. strangulata]|uniref:Kinesin motor domain-containing protein n=2 Tax=Aegilops tauschii subsp. strangulata TaxID=200361 RepID=A0A453KGM9_AEGTS|nr:kinesin-like protein KIN-4A isoform X2 [Aegilops tauschii subsp. strangulata]XP_044396632.1 kinesin-like protein KIN-4A isoform X2 [Triticum aestivum]
MTMEHGEDCCVKVAVHARPLIGDEKLQGCKDCVTVVPGKPQVQIGTHSFTFDHVYGSSGTPSTAMFDECVAPLVEGLFQGYNATVLAYGQTGSGKTYTMGTACKEGTHVGIIPRAMAALFDKIEKLKNQVDFQLRVSFIEILKEEVRDLLDPATVAAGKVENGNGHAGKLSVPGKPPVQIREGSNGVITLSGSTEVHVTTQKEMTTCLEQGSLSRATGSTNMNNQSSRSHAIFTITLEQMRKADPIMASDGMPIEEMNDDYLCAKLHLVDLAGSERAKRTGSDGLRFKEGVHINRGLLALGNVISALGDEKKRKEGAHVPYRDSKLTRLLQDSLGGNSKTVMIACISPADINAEETLNTLKYANRARNIQNKPIVNRNPIADEMKRMRQQLEYLQAELVLARGGGVGSDDVQGLRERISWLEHTNEDLCRELYGLRNHVHSDPCEPELHKTVSGYTKGEGLKRSLQSTEPFDVLMTDSVRGNPKDIDDEVAKEWEHTMLQDSLGKELNELNKQLEKKESEMKGYGHDTVALKQHFGKKLMELEEEKRAVQKERDRLLAEVESLNADGQTHKVRDAQLQKLKTFEAQILELKKKQESQVQLLKEKQKSDEAAKKLQEEIHFIKSQKVQLQHKIKQEAEQFRQWKASREKELLQLRKEGRRNEYERHKLQALTQRQKLVLQRKTEEAAMATKRLKEILEARKSSGRDNSAGMNGTSPGSHMSEKSLQKWLDQELEVMVHVHEVRNEYEKQSQLRALLGEELAILKKEDASPPRGKNGNSRTNTLSPNARQARIASLESMVTISSNTLVAMASQLSEAEERERAFSGRGRWNQLRSMGEAKSLLQYIFSVAADARCEVREKQIEIKEMKEQRTELVGILRHSESRRKELEKQSKQKEQTAPMATTPPGSINGSAKHTADDSNTPLSPVAVPAQKQLKYSAGIVNSPSKGVAALNKQLKMVPIAQLPVGKKVSISGQSGKLWRWKRSHHQWLLQFKWKWQKPWKLSEMIRHSDETITRARPRPQLLITHKPQKVM